ncbi:MAG: hypothetical protein AAF108_00510 [Planctomycetota bacterium]
MTDPNAPGIPPSSDPSPDGSGGLSPADQQAVDRLVEGSADLESERDRRVASLLGLLDTAADQSDAEGAPSPEELADAVLARIAYDERSRGVAPDGPSLSDADAQALDAWTLHGFRAAKVSGALRARAERHQAISELLTAAIDDRDEPITDADRDGLIARTMTAIDTDEQNERSRWQIGPEAGGNSTGRFRLQDVLALAAAITLAVGITLPVISEIGATSRKAATAADFAAAGMAFGAFAGDYDNTLPVYGERTGAAAPADAPHVWWQTGTDPSRSNSANLFTLVRLEYATLADVTSPGNRQAPTDPAELDDDWRSPGEVSYSYRVVEREDGLGPAADFEDPAAVVVLTDKSPVEISVSADGSTRTADVDISESSPNHKGRGQYALRADASIEWLADPWIERDGGRRDYLWIPASIQAGIESVLSGDAGLSSPGRPGTAFDGTETPGAPDDAFGGP